MLFHFLIYRRKKCRTKIFSRIIVIVVSYFFFFFCFPVVHKENVRHTHTHLYWTGRKLFFFFLVICLYLYTVAQHTTFPMYIDTYLFSLYNIAENTFFADVWEKFNTKRNFIAFAIYYLKNNWFYLINMPLHIKLIHRTYSTR